MRLIGDNLENIKKMMLARGESPKIPLETFPQLNKKLWGLHSKKLTIIGARTSKGKSAMALQIALDVAKQNIPTLFLSLEMYEDDVGERLFALNQKVDNFELLCGKFKNYPEQWKNFEQEMKSCPLVITDMLGKTWQQIDKYLNSLTVKPKVIIIDHLQEAKGAASSNQKEIIEEYLKSLRVMAIRDDFALVVCSQINRTAQGKDGESSPQLHNLKNSGYIEEGADVVILLEWPGKEKGTEDFIINVAKNRNGRTGWINLKYKPKYYWFYEEDDASIGKEYDEPERIDWDN